MKSILFTIALTSLAVAGCHSNGQLEPLERENRQLEDRLYELEYELEKLCDLYDECLAKNQVLTEQVEGGGARPRLDDAQPSGAGRSRSAPSDVDLGEPDDLGPPELGEPDDAPPGEGPQPGPVDDESLPAPPLSRRSAGRSRAALAHDEQASGIRRASHEEASRSPTRIELGGLPAAVSPEEPLAFFVEPRDDEGTLAEPGEIAVVAMARGTSGAPRRIAAWSLSADEAAACVRSTSSGERFYLELDWPESAAGALAAPGAVAIYVRYVPPDGAELLAEVQLGVRQARRAAPARPSWSPER